ncbi:hypothetical protein [Desulfonema magnum]|nr:hypothetical protein [Desulfonema magnum]
MCSSAPRSHGKHGNEINEMMCMGTRNDAKRPLCIPTQSMGTRLKHGNEMNEMMCMGTK